MTRAHATDPGTFTSIVEANRERFARPIVQLVKSLPEFRYRSDFIRLARDVIRDVVGEDDEDEERAQDLARSRFGRECDRSAESLELR